MLIAQLHEIVTDSLNRDLHTNAAFFGERLLSESDSEEVRHLLGRAYIGKIIIINNNNIGDGKFHKAFNILKDSKSSQCRYLFAQVCLKLNKLLEAETALLTDKHFSKSILSKDSESVIPNGSGGYYLLGLIIEKIGVKLYLTSKIE